jgi:hypothetical protein
MTAYPMFLVLAMLTMLAAVQAACHFPVEVAKQYAGLANPMQACHEALIQYADHTPGVSGTIAPAAVDGFLPPGASDPGLFTYVITAPGTVTTYLSVPQRGQRIAVAALQKLTLYSVVAGPVIGGQIVPRLPVQPVTAPPGVPDGVIAIQSIVRNH